MVRADEAVRWPAEANDAEGELCAAVNAEIEPAMNSFRRTPEDEVASEKADGAGAACGEFRGPGDEEPLAGQKRVLKRVVNRVLKRARR
jgi:hypothetical protein